MATDTGNVTLVVDDWCRTEAHKTSAVYQEILPDWMTDDMDEDLYQGSVVYFVEFKF